MDDKDLRQTVSASAIGTSTTTTGNPCTLGAQTGPIIVRQVIGENEAQTVLDIHVVVPDPKPAIEQIIDVFVKDVEINSVDVITDKVIVRGDMEIKTIYVACVPDRSVHAVEIRHYRWTKDIPLDGARRGMDADASVIVEFVDYDVETDTHAYRHKYGSHYDDDDDDDNDADECDDNCDDHDHHHHHHRCIREFDVSIVLKITAKVLADREVTLGTAVLPTTPKG